MRQDTYEAFDNITVRHADGSETRAEAEHPQGDDAISIERAGKEPELATKVNKAGIEIEARTGAKSGGEPREEAAQPQAAPTREKQLPEGMEPYKWKPGQSGNPKGRPKGSRNQLGEAFVADLYEDWQANGSQVLEDARKSKPADYLKVVASILPKDIKMTFETMSDGELSRRLDALTRSIGLRLEPSASNITEIEAEPAKPEDQDPL